MSAATFADHMVVLHHGRVLAAGAPWDIIQPALLQEVFGVVASVVTDAHTGRPLIVAHRAAGRTGRAGASQAKGEG